MRLLLLHMMRFFLPILFLTYLAGISCFYHVHVVNGVTIVHSHPFGKTHEHSSVELQTVSLLSHVVTDGAGTVLLLPLFIPLLLCPLFVSRQTAHCCPPYHGVVALRAPPMFR